MPTLTDTLPSGPPDPDALYSAFSDWAAAGGRTLYPHQDEALIEILSGSNLIIATPTGSGKSMVALAACYAALADDRVAFYTAPIKALVSEKFFELCAVFGADNVGMVTGDGSVNADAPIICCTAEILANLALREGDQADVAMVVMDEFHYYSEPDRGWAWQVPLLELPQAQFVLMSATLGEVDFFVEDLTRRTGRATAVIAGTERPVPLEFEWSVEPLHEAIAALVESGRAPVYVVLFTQAAALEQAQGLVGLNLTSRAERDAIAERIGNFRFAAGFGRTLSRLVRHGIGVHHAGMLPKYRRLVEQLAQDGLLKAICGTDTLGVGINVPIRTVLFSALTKFDGTKQRLLKAREFHQIAGRAGRAGYDARGYVVVQAPEHVIANLRAVAKAEENLRNGKGKARKVQRQKAPDGFINWDQQTFERLVAADPEPLTPRLRMSHSVLVNLLARAGNPMAHAARLLTDNHQDEAARRRLRRHALVLARELITSGVVERLPQAREDGRRHVLTVDLQRDFAVNNPLAPFALAVLETLDPASETYHLDVVSVFEAILDDPRPVLIAQQRRARGEAVAAMKSEGLDYEERMELLEEVSWPKPLAALLSERMMVYRQTHPWLSEDALSPKAIVREMYERAMSFTEVVSEYGLSRSEGIVLRYLSDAFRTLRHTVPEQRRTEALDDLVEWLGELIRQTDSSLLDEWEALTHPDESAEARPAPEQTRPMTSNTRAFSVMVRNALWARIELAARDDPDGLAALDRRSADLVDPALPVGLDGDAWDAALGGYYDDHDTIGIDADARSPRLLQITVESDRWQVRQVLSDPAGDHDWGIDAVVHLAESDAAGAAVVVATGLTRL